MGEGEVNVRKQLFIIFSFQNVYAVLTSGVSGGLPGRVMGYCETSPGGRILTRKKKTGRRRECWEGKWAKVSLFRSGGNM